MTSMRSVRGWRGVVCVVVAMVASLLGTTAAQAFAGVAPFANFPTAVNLGQAFTTQLTLTNISSGQQAGEPGTVTDIVVVPACTQAQGLVNNCAGGVDPGVFGLGAASTGATNCTTFVAPQAATPPITSFAITESSGVFSLTPAAPAGSTLVLAAGATCTISFVVTALKFPTVDVNVSPGAQTQQAYFATITTPSTTAIRGSGSDQTTVNRAVPAITTAVSGGTVTVGTPFYDTATVTGLVNPSNAGTVTFGLFNDAACTSNLLTSINPLAPGGGGTGMAASAPFTPTATGTYHWVATYSGDGSNSPAGPTACADPAEQVTVVPAAPASNFVALSPSRIEDTRSGVGGLKAPLGPGATVNVQVAGRGGVPVGATAVAFNLTVTQPTANGYVTVYPAGSSPPNASNVNFTASKTVPNLVVVKLGTGGQVALANPAGSTHVILDVAGYYTASGGNAGRFQPLVPARIADTRFNLGGTKLGAGQSIDVQVTGAGGAPATGVAAAVLNVAATNTTAASFLTVYPTGDPRPDASNVNFGAGETASNRVMSKVGGSGRVTIYNASGFADVVVDLNGTYTDASVAGTLGTYTPVDPARVLDTRNGTGGTTGPVAAGGTIDVQVTAVAGVPATGVRAVILNVTVTQPAASGFLTLFPKGTAQPNASDLNYVTGETRANLVVVQVGTNGRVSLYTWGATHAIADVAGYFT